MSNQQPKIDEQTDDTVIACKLLEKALKEFNGLPHSLGYDFTHTPEIEDFLNRMKAKGLRI